LVDLNAIVVLEIVEKVLVASLLNKVVWRRQRED
jgi:hypothetical protein